jgi:hypothetical protein
MDLNAEQDQGKPEPAKPPIRYPKETMQGYINLAKTSAFKPTDRFAGRLSELIYTGLPAKELINRIITAALEAEFGASFTRSKGFDKMVNTIADTIVANPDLRRQSLAIASRYMDKGVRVSKEEKPEKDKSKPNDKKN